MRRTKHWVDLYKNFVRSFIDTSRIYHHTPEAMGLDPHGWGVIELASEDRTKAHLRAVPARCADAKRVRIQTARP